MSATFALEAEALAKPFPTRELMPRDETEAAKFVSLHPEFDGRGVIVAVFDTGVDPAAIGMQTTTTGAPKVLDVVDASGSGDVRMDGRATCTDVPATVTGVTGRSLRLNPAWRNPTGAWRLGAKVVSQIYPRGLSSRISSLDTRTGEEQAAELLAAAEAEVATAKAAVKPSDPALAKEHDKRVADLEKRADLARAAREELAKEFSDDVVDVVAWHDGTVWRAAVDTSREGDLRAAPGLASFRVERQFAVFDRRTQLSFCLNIYDDGAVVSIVTDAGSHGSHVASIIGGHQPGHPELNGVAPGAQIVSVKIGDSRLGSMETLQGLTRGVRAAIENGCDLINMSYGEPASWPHGGEFIRLIDDAVRTRGIIFVTSAGNAGPALSTVGAPACSTSAAIAIGAMVSPSTAEAAYAARRGTAAKPYTWSSRGPVISGAAGVSVCAPGSAVTSIPQWNLVMSQLMNGTSMSSPNACGCIALLLSAAKQSGINYTPHSIRRCVENAAVAIPGAEVWATGKGLLHVSRTWSLMQRGAEAAEAEKREQLAIAAAAAGKGAAEGFATASNLGVDPAAAHGAGAGTAAPISAEGLEPWQIGLVGATRFVPDAGSTFKLPVASLIHPDARGEDWTHPHLSVRVPLQGAGPGSHSDVGIYWREAWQSKLPATAQVQVIPEWHPLVHERVRGHFVRRFSLVATASWISVPKFITVTAEGGSVDVHVDPTGLAAGAHYAEVRAYLASESVHDHGDLPSGPEWFVPITIVKPETAGADYEFRSLGPDSASFASTNVVLTAAAASSDEFGPELHLAPGKLERRFLQVPRGATYCEVTVTRTDAGCDDDEHAGDASHGVEDASFRMIVVHASQVIPAISHKHTSDEQYLRLRPGETATLVVGVSAERTLEVVVGQYWSSLGATVCTARIRFRGVLAEPASAVFDLQGVARIDVRAELESALLNPAAKLTHVRIPLAPTSSVIVPRGSRDYTTTGAPLYELRLEYSFTPEVSEAVRPWIPQVHGQLYESLLMSQGISFIDTESGKLTAFSDAFPENVSLTAHHKYKIIAQLVASRRETLEDQRSLPLVLVKKLAAPLSLKTYSSVADAQSDSRPYRERKLRQGTADAIYVAAPSIKSLPKGCSPGWVLTGTAELQDNSKVEAVGDGRCPGGEVSLSFVVPPQPKSAAGDSSPAADGPASDTPGMSEVDVAVRDASIAALKKLRSDAAFDELFSRLQASYPDHLPLLLERLQHAVKRVDVCKAACSDADRSKIQAAAEDVLRVADPDAVALHFGRRFVEDDADTAAKTAHEAMTKRKSAIIEACWARVRSLCWQLPRWVTASPSSGGADAGAEASSAGVSDEEFRAALAQLRAWVDTTKPEYVVAELEDQLRHGRYAAALETAQAARDGKGLASAAQLSLRRALYEKLGFAALVQRMDASLAVRKAMEASLPLSA